MVRGATGRTGTARPRSRTLVRTLGAGIAQPLGPSLRCRCPCRPRGSGHLTAVTARCRASSAGAVEAMPSPSGAGNGNSPTHWFPAPTGRHGSRTEYPSRACRVRCRSSESGSVSSATARAGRTIPSEASVLGKPRPVVEKHFPGAFANPELARKLRLGEYCRVEFAGPAERFPKPVLKRSLQPAPHAGEQSRARRVQVQRERVPLAGDQDSRAAGHVSIVGEIHPVRGMVRALSPAMEDQQERIKVRLRWRVEQQLDVDPLQTAGHREDGLLEIRCLGIHALRSLDEQRSLLDAKPGTLRVYAWTLLGTAQEIVREWPIEDVGVVEVPDGTPRPCRSCPRARGLS